MVFKVKEMRRFGNGRQLIIKSSPLLPPCKITKLSLTIRSFRFLRKQCRMLSILESLRELISKAPGKKRFKRNNKSQWQCACACVSRLKSHFKSFREDRHKVDIHRRHSPYFLPFWQTPTFVSQITFWTNERKEAIARCAATQQWRKKKTAKKLVVQY